MRSRFTWWHVLWLLLFMSGLSFRARTTAEISQSPIDSWALYRIACVGMVGLVLFLRLTLRKTNWPPLLFSGIIGTFALYPLVSLVSTIWSVHPPWTLYKSIEFLIDLSVLAAILATVQSTVEYKRLVNWTWILLGLLVISAWVGAALDPSEALFGDPSLSFSPLPMRLWGIVPVLSSNDLSEVSAILALVALCRLLADAGAQQKKFRYWVLFVAAAATLLVAQTRGSFTGFFVGIILLLILTHRFVLVAVAGTSSFLVATALLFFTNFGTAVQSFALRGQSIDEATGLSGRIEVWQVSFEQIVKHPWIGYGGFAGTRFVVLSRNSIGSSTLSSYIDSMLDIGVAGPIILLIVLVSVGWLLFRSIRDSGFSQFEVYLALEMFIVFIVLVVRSVESSNLISHPMLPFLTVLGFAEFLRRKRRTPLPD